MTAIRKREINLWRMPRQGQARISRFDARFTAAALLYSPTCSLFSSLEPTNQRTKEGRLSRIPAATSTANQIKVALESIYAATSAATLKNRPASRRNRVRLCSRDHHLRCIMDGSNFFLREAFDEGLIFFFYGISIDISVDDLTDCSEKGLGRRAMFELHH